MRSRPLRPGGVTVGFRQVHLDFHTSGAIGDVGADFDADAFAAAAKAAHADSVTVFAKCHHGHLYYATDHPARHPGLPGGLDLLGRQIEALHRAGIRAPIYLSVQVDEFAAAGHPEWLAVAPDGKPVGPAPLEPGWHTMDMSSPYRAYLEGQLAEVLERFAPVDGIFFDMCWNQVSVSRFAQAGMARKGLDPADEADRGAYADAVARQYMRRLFRQVRGASGRATVYFNARPLRSLGRDFRSMTHVEIEALPTGGWGYMYFPLNVRYARPHRRPYVGMTARFHRGWGDFGGLKPEAALTYEVCQMLAHGASCSIGDQLHPRGAVDRAAWERIGRVYDYAGRCRPWCQGASAWADVALLRPEAGGYHVAAGSCEEGAARMLMHLKAQFNVIDAAGSLEGYRLAILPDHVAVGADLARRLDRFVAGGGRVLASGSSGLGDDGRRTWRGLPIEGAARACPFARGYFRPGRDLAGAMEEADHVLYDRPWYVTPGRGARAMGRIVEPYFDRTWRHFCSHRQTPPARATRWPMAVVGEAVAYIPYPVFGSFGATGLLAYRKLVQAVWAALSGRPAVETDAPASAEVSRMRCGRATVLHLLYAPIDPRAGADIIENVVPLRDVGLSVALPARPARAYLAPQRTPLEFAWADGRAQVTVPRVDLHQMVVFE